MSLKNEEYLVIELNAELGTIEVNEQYIELVGITKSPVGVR